jgi:flagellar biosynthesis/type III secretory pathway M-ring protein FliF/YscJ
LTVLIAILTLALVAVVVLVISAPLRPALRRAPARPIEAAERDADALRGELESAREAKYREIRDAELDYRTGKLSRADYEAIDGSLRAEALEILNRLEAGEATPRAS